MAGSALLIFDNIFFFDLKNGPKYLPINAPRLDANLKPKILNIMNMDAMLIMMKYGVQKLLVIILANVALEHQVILVNHVM